MTTRRKIFFAWEAGGNYGHASKIAAMTGALAAHDITIAARDVVNMRRFCGDLDITLLPAPVPPDQRGAAPAKSYSETLRFIGYRDPEQLGPLFETWQTLFEIASPDVIVCQSAPIALLAARHSPYPVVHVGTGHDMPPPTDPFLPFFNWHDPPPTLAEGEAETLATINTMLRERGFAPKHTMMQMLDADLSLLATWPELDHYPADARSPTPMDYVGVLHAASAGTELVWEKETRRIFAYLRASTPAFAEMIKSLADLGQTHDVVLAAPELSPKMGDMLRAKGIRWINGPVRLDGFLDKADLCITHASFGVVAAAMAAGVPQIALPTHSEQLMIAYVLGQRGVGLSLSPETPPKAFIAAIEKSLGAVPMRETAKALGETITARESTPPAEVIAKQVLRIAAEKAVGAGEGTRTPTPRGART